MSKTVQLPICPAPRVIARLDVKAPNLIKGIHLEGLRVIGDPNLYAKEYYQQGADEIIYIDSVASLYGRNSLTDLVKSTANDVYIPITVGGGLRSINDIGEMLKNGADKVAINTAGVRNPKLLDEIAKIFGSQCLVLSIEAKQQRPGIWEAYTDNGRERTGMDVLTWIKEAQTRGVGEILLTSIDQEGTRRGFDLALINQVSEVATVPIIASGGCGTLDHARDGLLVGHCDGIALADALHYERFKIADVKQHLGKAGFSLRGYDD